MATSWVTEKIPSGNNLNDKHDSPKRKRLPKPLIVVAAAMPIAVAVAIFLFVYLAALLDLNPEVVDRLYVSLLMALTGDISFTLSNLTCWLHDIPGEGPRVFKLEMSGQLAGPPGPFSNMRSGSLSSTTCESSSGGFGY